MIKLFYLQTLRYLSSWMRAHTNAAWFFGVLIVAFAFFSAMKIEPLFMDGDPFYHAKIAQLILEKKDIVRDFPWLPMSVFRNGYYDHHFLFHVFLVPFVAVIGDPLIAIRIATSFLSALFLAVFCAFFRRLLPCVSFFPLLILLFSSSLMFRLSLDKAPAISLIFFFCGLYALIRRRHAAIFCISFLYVWLYDAWPLIFLAGGFFCITDAYAKLCASDIQFSFRAFPFARFFSLCVQKEHLLLLASCVGGLLAGIIINPYFPHNILFYKTHLLSIAVMTSGVLYGIGNEWLPVDPLSFAQRNLFFMVFWICALCWTLLQAFSRIRMASLSAQAKTPSTLSAPSIFFFIFSLFLFFATIKSQRMAEYFIPIGTATIVFSFQDFFRRALWREWMRSIRLFFENTSLLLQNIFCFMIGVFVFALFFQAQAALYGALWSDVRTGHYSFYSMARVGAFISKNIPKGSLIINDDWSYFPQLMYYADKYAFPWGLDPTFTHDADEKFFSTLSKLGKEKEHGKISDTLKNDIHARYLLLSRKQYAPEKKLAFLARRDAGLKKIYEDDEALLYEVR